MMKINSRTVFGSAFALMATFWLVGSCYLYIAFYPAAQAGFAELERGRYRLLNQPDEAARHFDQARDHFHQAMRRWEKHPLPLRALSALPPLRWQFDILSFGYRLSDAGTAASAARSDFPALLPEQVSPSIATTYTPGLNDFDAWLNRHEADISLVATSLESASDTLDRIPNWAAFGQSARAAELKKETRQLSRQTEQARTALKKIQAAWQADAANLVSLEMTDETSQVLAGAVFAIGRKEIYPVLPGETQPLARIAVSKNALISLAALSDQELNEPPADHRFAAWLIALNVRLADTPHVIAPIIEWWQTEGKAAVEITSHL